MDTMLTPVKMSHWPSRLVTAANSYIIIRLVINYINLYYWNVLNMNNLYVERSTGHYSQLFM